MNHAMKCFIMLFLFMGAKTETDDKVEIIRDSFRLKKALNFDLNFRLKSDSSNEVCNSQLNYFYDSLYKNLLWARKMRDAWGNIPSGVFSGNQFDFGNFDQCIKLKHVSENAGEILGQHCTLMVPFDREDRETIEQTQMAKINTFSRS